MSDLYQSNRKLVETYRQQLQQKIVSLHQAGQSSNNSEIDPQKFYLGFNFRNALMIFPFPAGQILDLIDSIIS